MSLRCKSTPVNVSIPILICETNIQVGTRALIFATTIIIPFRDCGRDMTKLSSIPDLTSKSDSCSYNLALSWQSATWLAFSKDMLEVGIGYEGLSYTVILPVWPSHPVLDLSSSAHYIWTSSVFSVDILTCRMTDLEDCVAENRYRYKLNIVKLTIYLWF